MNQKSKAEQLFILAVSFTICFIVFVFTGCTARREDSGFTSVNRFEACGSGCLSGEVFGADSFILRCYGGKGCFENSISCGTLDNTGYADCVFGDKCSGCYMAGCLSGSCVLGLRCGGCVVCGEPLVEFVDIMNEFGMEVKTIYDELDS